jgi:integrase/recombinase XerD
MDKREARQGQNTNYSAKKLGQTIRQYHIWMETQGYKTSGIRSSRVTLKRFLFFIARQRIDWQDIFTWDSLRQFYGDRASLHVYNVMKAFVRYVFNQGLIDKSLWPVKRLPLIYEQYLHYYEQSHTRAGNIKWVLRSFDQWLQKSRLQLSGLRIEHIDAFLGKFLAAGYADASCRLYRCYVRGFLRYLYHQQGILKTDLAPMVADPPQFSHAKPPKFLRPHEIKQLFERLGQNLSTAKGLRNYAMVNLAYWLGLRPIEISLICLDDICFARQQLQLPCRKNTTPLILPLPEEPLKAIAAYLVGGRPKSQSRHLFLTIHAPCRPVSAGTVTGDIGQCVRKLGLPASAYWLRHSYAQMLLESGSSIYEVKEMLGHNSIESTGHYLSIHIKLMREVLLNEPV